MSASKSSSVGELPARRGSSEEVSPGVRWLWEHRWLHRRVVLIREFFHPLVELLRITPPATEKVLQRIEMMERHIALPIRVAGIAILFQYFKPWITQSTLTLEISYEATRYFLFAYAGLSLLFAPVLIWMRRLPPAFVERSVFAMSLVDGIFLGVLTLVTGGYDSSVYWLFLAMMVRTAVSVPGAISQLLLNLTLSLCYLLAGVIDSLIAANLGEVERSILELSAAENPREPLLLRVTLLLLMTFGCYAVQVLLERQRRAEEEARELAVREVQLQSAGRLAGEFAHQVKNPLAIINNAVFSLRRTRKSRDSETAEQLQMIHEEVERVDRIITQVMGYAQLCEGHVEKLDVIEELDHAIERVFPPAAHYPVRVHRRYVGPFPALLMQRRHASEAFINVLQNAREALEPKGGNIHVRARCLGDRLIEVSVQDDGPGIPPDKLGRIFEAYYTTKERGTGLGLATVKHTLELYGGSVRVESELGKGARFVLSFPAKSLMKLAKMS